MAKKSIRRAARADALRVVGGGVPQVQGHRELSNEAAGTPDPFVAELVATATENRSFDSETQVLDFFIDSICGKLGDGTSEQGEMQEFLRLLIDTDPAFGEELLKGVGVRK